MLVLTHQRSERLDLRERCRCSAELSRRDHEGDPLPHVTRVPRFESLLELLRRAYLARLAELAGEMHDSHEVLELKLCHDAPELDALARDALARDALARDALARDALARDVIAGNVIARGSRLTICRGFRFRLWPGSPRHERDDDDPGDECWQASDNHLLSEFPIRLSDG